MGRPSGHALGALGRLVVARARRRRTQLGLIAAVLAAATGLLVASGPLDTRAADRALRADLSRAGELSFAVQRTAGGAFAAFDATVRKAFAARVLGAPRSAVTFASRDDVTLVALEDLPGVEPCRPPVPCAAVALRGEPGDAYEGLRLEVRGRRAPPAFAADVDGAVVAVRGPAAVADWPGLRRVPRTYRWSAAVIPERVRPWNAEGAAGSVDAAAAALSALQGDVANPASALRSLRSRGQAAARHGLIITTLIATVLVFFAGFIASRLRRDADRERQRLAGLGATPVQLGGFEILNALAVVVPGVLTGIAGGLAAAALAGLPAAQLPVAASLALGLVVGALATGLLASAGGRTAWQAPALAAALSVVAVLAWVGISRGALGSRDLSRHSSLDPTLLLLPPAVVVLTAGLAAGVSRLALPRLSRRLLRLSPAAALALVGMARDRRRAATAAGFVAAALATGLFALVYETTLRDGERDAAAFSAGADVRELRSRAPLMAPLTDRQGWALRRSATTTADGKGFALLGAPGAMLPRLRGWRADFSSLSARRIAEALEPAKTLRLEGVPIGTTRRLSMAFTLRNSRANLALAFQAADGTFARLPLATEVDPGRHRSELPVPPALRGARLVAVEVSLPLGAAATADTGTIALEPLRDAGGAVITDFRGASWEGSGSSFLDASVPPLLRYGIFGDTTNLGAHVRQPAAGSALPALLSESLAARAPGRTVPVRLADGSTLELQPIGVAEHFPTLPDGDWAVVDSGRLVVTLNSAFAGAAVPRERWLIGTRPFGPGLVGRAAELAAERADPLGRRLHQSLRAAMLLGGVLIVAALALLTTSSASERRGELAELEAAGLTTGQLRRQLHLAAATVVGLGLVVGVAGAAALTALVTRLVAVTARGGEPVPPLRTAVPVGPALAGIVLVLALSAVAVALAARGALRGQEAGRLSGGE